MKKLITEAKVLICAGSGGVGKTTLSASLAFWAACRGLRVLVLTIDPSQRLKTTLGLNDQGDLTEIKHEKIKGSLFAAVINPKRTFDEFVMRAAQSDQRAQQILKNRLYIQMSTNLAGSQEFTALEQVYSAYQSGLYDLIVVDTPPTKHAIDFLTAPQKLSALFSESVAKWFRDPQMRGRNFLVGLVQTGTRQVLKALELLTGSEFMHELAEFFSYIQSWQSKLEERIAQVHRLLVSSETRFLIISHFDEAKIKEAIYFSKEIKKGGYSLSALIINRAYPTWLGSESTVRGSDPLSEYYQRHFSYYQQRRALLLKNAEGFKQIEIFEIPDLDEEISNLDGVSRLAQLLEEQSER